MADNFSLLKIHTNKLDNQKRQIPKQVKYGIKRQQFVGDVIFLCAKSQYYAGMVADTIFWPNFLGFYGGLSPKLVMALCHFYAPNFEKVGGAYCFWLMRMCVCHTFLCLLARALIFLTELWPFAIFGKLRPY